MTIKTTHLSIKKYETINGISAPGVYITFPSFFKKVTHIEAKTIIGYSFRNNVLRLTIEENSDKPNIVKVNRNNSIFISKQKCPELTLLNILNKSTRVKFAIKHGELCLDLSKFSSEVLDFNDAKTKIKKPEVAVKPSFEYYKNDKKKVRASS